MAHHHFKVEMIFCFITVHTVTQTHDGCLRLLGVGLFSYLAFKSKAFILKLAHTTLLVSMTSEPTYIRHTLFTGYCFLSVHAP